MASDDGEFSLIAQLAPFLADSDGGVAVGSGDDAAVLDLDGRWICLAVDVVVEGVHFRRDVSSLADVGWKAVAVNVSDLAAMGAAPTAAVVGLCRPKDLPAADVETLYAGMDEACRRWGLRLVGGDTVSADALAISVTVLGETEPGRAVRRSGAQAGDAVVLVGALGAAASALQLLAEGHDPAENLLAAHRRPQALPAGGRVLAEHGATAMIDVSDGLGADLGHLCAASGVAATVRWVDLPLAEGVAAAATETGQDLVRLACAGGEDFALLATLPAALAEDAVATAAEAEGVPGAVIGRIEEVGEHPQVRLELTDGSVRDLAGYGFDHFAQQEG